MAGGGARITAVVARLLATVLPRLRFERVDGLGHMGPLTHPEVANPVIEDFLRRELTRK